MQLLRRSNYHSFVLLPEFIVSQIIRVSAFKIFLANFHSSLNSTIAIIVINSASPLQFRIAKCVLVYKEPERLLWSSVNTLMSELLDTVLVFWCILLFNCLSCGVIWRYWRALWIIHGFLDHQDVLLSWFLVGLCLHSCSISLLWAKYFWNLHWFNNYNIDKEKTSRPPIS